MGMGGFTNMDKKVRFALVGCGRIGIRHAEQISNNKRAKLTAVCDIIKERADNFAKQYGAKAFYNYEELLKEDFDIVSICTPSGIHAEMSINALNKNINVLCEKPMSLNISDADKIVNAEKNSNGKFFLVKQNRHNPPIKELKELVYNKKLGKIIMMGCNVFWNRNKEYYQTDDWKGTMELDGGALMTQCSHFLDLMVWIGGRVKKVNAKMFNLSHDYIETEDTGTITLVFENGSVGFLQYTTSVYEKNFEGSMTVLGTEGTIKVGGQYLDTLEFWKVHNIEKPNFEENEPLLPSKDGTYKTSKSKHDKVIENVIQVLLEGKEIATNSIQGRESIEVMQAAYISAIKNKEITLPLKGEEYSFKLDKQPPLSGHKKSV